MKLRKVLLACGILSSLVYVGTDIFGALKWEGYSYTSQAISELAAFGSPVRHLLIPLYTLYSLLVIAFGWGVWLSSRGKRALLLTGGFFLGMGLLDLTGPFASMKLRGTGSLEADRMHLILTAVTVLLITLTMIFGSKAAGKGFRIYTFVSLAIVLIFGAWAGTFGDEVAANQATPWLGIIERICIHGYHLWALMLAVVLLRKDANP